MYRLHLIVKFTKVYWVHLTLFKDEGFTDYQNIRQAHSTSYNFGLGLKVIEDITTLAQQWIQLVCMSSSTCVKFNSPEGLLQALSMLQACAQHAQIHTTSCGTSPFSKRGYSSRRRVALKAHSTLHSTCNVRNVTSVTFYVTSVTLVRLFLIIIILNFLLYDLAHHKLTVNMWCHESQSLIFFFKLKKDTKCYGRYAVPWKNGT